MNQTSIFDITPQQEIADLPIAVSKPKAVDFAGFKIGDRVGGLNKFKNLEGNITGFEVCCDTAFANIGLDFQGSIIKYCCPISNLRLLGKDSTDCDRHSTDNKSISPDKPKDSIDNSLVVSSFQIGDRVLVLEHQFVSGKNGIVKEINEKLCVVDFGSGENIWAIAPSRLKKM